MVYYSHSQKTENGDIEGSKLLKTHIKGVSENAKNRIMKNIDFGHNFKEILDLILLICSFHDFGKYTSYFQNYLLQKEPIDRILKQHSRIGGILSYNNLYEKDNKLAIIALFVIFQHHTKLIDIKELPNFFDGNLEEIFKRQKSNIERNIEIIQNELSLRKLKDSLFYPDAENIRKIVRHWIKKDNDIKYYFLINYLFSLLIEADKLDASGANIYSPKSIKSTVVDDRYPVLKFDDDTNIRSLTNNELRNYCRTKVANKINDTNILNNYLFTLTAPTGIGKTMIALDFSLKLKNKIQENINIEVPIIYSLPFINIIEQSLDEYEKTLPKEVKILSHYQFADIFSNNDEDETNYNQKLMSLETWQSDIIITTFVQFFESLIGNRNKLLKKFNHFANSIIILDEVQTLRLEQMPLIGSALYFLTKFLKARIILMTATKPKILELAQTEILNNENENLNVSELLDNHEEVFSYFNRTKIIPLIDETSTNESIEDNFINNVFPDKWNSKNSCLIVCNTVNRSIKIHNVIQEYLITKKLKNPLFYLSTNIVSANRFEIIKTLKNNLTDKIAPILISTQVVEAGVDLDFDVGFRDIGPIDSIIQVAGRINRNNNVEKKNSPLYVLDFKDALKVYDRITYEQAKKALKQQEVFYETDYLELITKYFDDLSDRSSFDTSRKIFESMKVLRYTSESKDDYPVSSFKIIKESKYVMSVFIELDDRAKECKKMYLNLIDKKIKMEEFEHYKRDFNQRIIAVPIYYLNSLKQENNTALSENIYIVPKELLSKYYDMKTGFIRKKEDEDENKIVML